MQTKFTSGYRLDELPWFEDRGGELHVADPDVGPVIDVHTHLALSFVRRRSVDLFAEPRATEHYLPMARPIDLELYSNLNFTDEDLARLKKDLGLGAIFGGDGMRQTHTVPNLLREMRALGIVRSVLLAIELPGLSDNTSLYLDVANRVPELMGFASVHPMTKGAADKIASLVDRGAVGLKIHPAVQHMRPDHPKCIPIYHACAELDLPILWHCGPVAIEDRHGRYCSQLEHYWRAVAQAPDTTFILGHTGALQNRSAVDLVNAYPNVWCELACQSLPAVRHTLENVPEDRVMFGTDWPFYHQATNLARTLIATEGNDALRKRVLYQNAARLFDLDLVGLEREHRAITSQNQTFAGSPAESQTALPTT